MLMARDFHCGFKIAVYVRKVYVRRVVEREGVIKFPAALSRKASGHAAAFSHFSHLCHGEPGSGWVGCRRGVETGPGLGCLRGLPTEGGVPGSREETAPCPACPPREVRRLGRLGLSRPLRRGSGPRLKPLDQNWRGWILMSVAPAGCGWALNG